MRRAGIEPVKLTYKEGLGLINGPQMMAGGAALLLRDAERLLKNALIATAMTVDVLKGMERAFDARVQRVRPFAGQNVAARAVRRLVEGSEIMADPAGRVQDGYSLRCAPQITGPSIDAWHFARRTVEIEMNSAGDNPLFFPEDGIHIAAGNFHGQAVGMAMDYLAIAMSEVANLSERHTNRLLNPVLSGLPDFLVEGKGLNSGLMVAQYTAAALVSENKILSHPASVDSISVSADQEDHVSMGPIAVRKCAEILRNVRAALAIEMMCAAQAIDFRRPLSPGRGTRVAYREIRKTVPFLEDDRVLYPDIEKMVDLLRGDVILGAVEAEVGELGLIPDLEEGGESAPRAAAAAPGIRCACNELTEPRVFLLGALEIRGSECVRCRRVYLNEGDMGKAIEARSKMRERGVC
jgi:histidine ammonia-lyase